MCENCNKLNWELQELRHTMKRGFDKNNQDHDIIKAHTESTHKSIMKIVMFGLAFVSVITLLGKFGVL